MILENSQGRDSWTKDNGQIVSREKISSVSSNSPLHKIILVVDGDSDIAFTIRMGLEERDPTMQVHSFDIAVAGLSKFKPDFYDLLLIDINMPWMDGSQLAHKLLQKDIKVRVYFMTSGEFNMPTHEVCQSHYLILGDQRSFQNTLFCAKHSDPMLMFSFPIFISRTLD